MKRFTSMSSRYLHWGVVCLLLLTLSACDRPGKDDEESAKDDENKAPLIIPVEAVLPERGPISSYFETSTRVEAERKVDVMSKSMATVRCIKLLVDEGDQVETGQVLAELEKEEAQASYNQSEIQVRQNKTSYDLAKRQYEEGLGAKNDMDNARYTYEQSLATLESQRIQLDNLTIRAPIDGVVTARGIQQGMLVSSGIVAFSIMDPDSYILTISPPEKELLNLSVGQAAKVRIDAIPGREFKANIRRINPSVDPVSGTVKVVLDFEKALRDQLRESAFARVKLVMDTRNNVILIPKEAIVEENGRRYLFILAEQNADDDVVMVPDYTDSDDKDGGSLLTPEAEASDDSDTQKTDSQPALIAKRVEIQTGLEDSEKIQVFFGLKDTDRLVTNGQHSLKDGAFVRITNIADEIKAHADMTADEALAAAKEKRKTGESSDKSGPGKSGKFSK